MTTEKPALPDDEHVPLAKRCSYISPIGPAQSMNGFSATPFYRQAKRRGLQPASLRRRRLDVLTTRLPKRVREKSWKLRDASRQPRERVEMLSHGCRARRGVFALDFGRKGMMPRRAPRAVYYYMMRAARSFRFMIYHHYRRHLFCDRHTTGLMRAMP